MTTGILLTGGTGFLGTETAASLIRSGNETVYALVRAESTEAAYHRLRAAWYPYKELYGEIGRRVFPVTGDITLTGLGLNETDASALRNEVSYIIHTAAETGLQKDEDELMKINRDGTANLLSFAGTLPSLKRFIHVSTAYVSGTRTGVISEDDPPAQEFSSLYEKSKACAETLVRASSLPYTICRPGMIVGRSTDGRAKNFNTIYYLLKQYLMGKIRVLPVRGDMKLNLVPVDYVADSIVRILHTPEADNKTYHLTCPEEIQPQVCELIGFVRSWAAENLDTKLPDVRYVPAPLLKNAGAAYNRRTSGRTKNALTNLLALSPYFFSDQHFDRNNADALTECTCPSWQEYFASLLEFACRKNFMKQTERTVFEQAAVRQASTSHPINYYDVASDGIHKVTGQEVNERVDRIVDALWAWGLRKGDRVALTGINSVDYMTLDQAIGRSGLVSVPIYYTTPVGEVQTLLERSGAKWLFVGDRRIMEHIELLADDIRVVVFSDGLQVHKSNVLHWEQFLYEAKEKAPVQYVDPEDLATIRYTSGTTGEPKGVKFNFAQLAWMGEVLSDLLSWQDRCRSMRYLSFLPLSHVVEGILASYAPYYVLADVDFYFLNNFGSLIDALPKVRPNVFFSVPRFYEKLWSTLTANALGKRYLAMSDGPARKALASVLRTAVLKKAGLDACRQLIVGSAPISEALLLHFRKLGIEIYNAYGQAEAPLITINRFGDNVIPTIGTPLPETEVTVAEDGELIVRGPQVCLGYYGLETDTIKDGVLKTGDLGTLHEDGHITLHGRKKEMIVTAYGKNISIPKIEERLKNIAGVTEAVLIGEKKPYCTALLWLDREIPDLDAQIEEMNRDLSHPEQIRRYTIIAKPLSIQAGELTPNLKVRRAVVEEHFTSEIEEMYR